MPDPRPGPTRLRRRDLALMVAGTAAAAALPAFAGSSASASPPAVADPGPGSKTVRLGAVPALTTGGLLSQLLAGFEASSPYQVALTTGNLTNLYAQARAGELDILTTHFGTEQLRDFVSDQFGRWPQLVLSNAFVLIAHPSDPAEIIGLDDPVEAFSRIADTQSPFVVNNLASVVFKTETLWHAAGTPDQQGWFIDNGLRGGMAVQAATQLGGYTLWGLHPFLMFRQQTQSPMVPLLYRDSLLQRAVASVVVHPGRIPGGVNIAGALALEKFLVDPATQGAIRAFRHPEFDLPIFWPAAHHNDHGEEPG